MPRRRVSPGVPKRSAPCPPGLRSPKQPYEKSRPRTPDFDLSQPMRRNKHRPVTVARSIYIGGNHGNLSAAELVVPKPRKRIQSVAMVSVSIVTLIVQSMFN